MKTSLTIVTGNSLKYSELATNLEDFFVCTQRTIDGYEIQGKPEEIILHKLHHAYKILERPVLVDDTSLHIADLNGFPGPYIRDFFKAFTPYEMGVKFAGSRVEAVCRLAIMQTPDDILLVEGRVQGTVVYPTTHDDQGRQFDLFVQVDGTDRPMIEYSYEQKNAFSHRGKAMETLLEKLKKKQVASGCE